MNMKVIITMVLMGTAAAPAQAMMKHQVATQAAQIARTVAFHGSRYVAGQLVKKGIDKARSIVYLKTKRVKPNHLWLYTAFTKDILLIARLCALFKTPQLLNQATQRLPYGLLAPQAGQSATAGRIALAVGMYDFLMPALKVRGKLSKYISWLVL